MTALGLRGCLSLDGRTGFMRSPYGVACRSTDARGSCAAHTRPSPCLYTQEVTNPNIQYPSYYTQPFHAYSQVRRGMACRWGGRGRGPGGREGGGFQALP